MANITPAAIAAAVAALGTQEPAWAERYQSGGRLLSNGGWQRRPQFVAFPHRIVCQPGACSCQEGRGPIVCLHQVALAVLDYAETHCADCGMALTDDTIARIGHHLASICRSCRGARSGAARRRQSALDRAAVAPC